MGSGDYKTIGDAIKGIVSWRKSSGNVGRVELFVKNCTYKEKIAFPASVGLVSLRGESAYGVFFTFNDDHNTTRRDDPSRIYGTRGSASTSVQADYFIVQDITFVNTSPDPPPSSSVNQAVAYVVTGNYVAHYGCRFFGWQDTLYDDTGNHYFYNCYIQGRIDFIFGNGTSIYEECTLFAPKAGALTAQRRSAPAENSGYVFLHSNILGDAQTMLGRAWGNYSRVVYAYCNLDNVVDPANPWGDWGSPENRPKIYYAEYKNTGPSAVTVPRNDWTYILTDEQAAPFISYKFIDSDNWKPSFPPLKPTSTSGPFSGPPRPPPPST